MTPNCEREPIGPLYSVGAVSAKNFGQKSENAPAEAPKRNLPTTNRGNESNIHITDPVITRIFVSKMQLRLPIANSGPPNSAPTADPAIVIV